MVHEKVDLQGVGEDMKVFHESFKGDNTPDGQKANACVDVMNLVIARCNTLQLKPTGPQLLGVMDALLRVFQ